MINILANDGISQAGMDALQAKGFNIVTEKVAQEDLINTINSSRPSKLKGDFLINIHLASTMGPSIKLDIDSIID